MSLQVCLRVKVSFVLSLSFSSDSSDGVICLGVTEVVKTLPLESQT